MFENKTGRIIRCPECFSKDIDVFMLYDEETDEFYCHKCCYTSKLEKAEEYMANFVKNKYVIKRHFNI